MYRAQKPSDDETFLTFSALSTTFLLFFFNPIKRLRNKAAWLELQLTLHFGEDQRAEDDYNESPVVVEDNCMKCQQLRKMLEESLQLPLVTTTFLFDF